MKLLLQYSRSSCTPHSYGEIQCNKIIFATMKTTAVVGSVTGEYSKAIEHREQLVLYVKQKQACCGVKKLTCREIKNAKVLADLRAADAAEERQRCSSCAVQAF